MKHASIAAEQLHPWAQLNDVQLNGVKITSSIISPGGVTKGGGLISTTRHASGDVLLSINQELILSREAVLQCAKTDKHLRQLLDVLEDFIQVGQLKVGLCIQY